jgi:hypothetical protein
MFGSIYIYKLSILNHGFTKIIVFWGLKNFGMENFFVGTWPQSHSFFFPLTLEPKYRVSEHVLIRLA